MEIPYNTSSELIQNERALFNLLFKVGKRKVVWNEIVERNISCRRGNIVDK